MAINDNTIKGRLAEAIIQELFISMGFNVFSLGVENTVPEFARRENPFKGTIAEQVRSLPDFVVIRNNTSYFIEVKYRTSGEFKPKPDYQYPDAYIILVTPKYIKVRKASDLIAGKSFIWLSQIKDFETDKEVILEYIEFVKKYFQEKVRIMD